MQKRKPFNQDLKESKTPEQTYQVLLKHSDEVLAQLGLIFLTSKYDGYIESVGRILKSDKFRQKLDKNNHRSNALTKNNAKKIFDSLNRYANKAVKAL